MLIVYFSSVTENTKRFVERVGLPSRRIPLHRSEGELRVDEPFVLICPTYGGGASITHQNSRPVPRQVIRFLNDEHNRSLLRGVIASGNSNFGADYCRAGEVISAKCNVPYLYRFELMGLAEDAARVRSQLIEHAERLGLEPLADGAAAAPPTLCEDSAEPACGRSTRSRARSAPEPPADQQLPENSTKEATTVTTPATETSAATPAALGKNVPEPASATEQLDYHALNALLNLYDEHGQIQFEKDREAANQYFLQHVNQNTVYFHDLEEKMKYLVDNKYYEPGVVEQYDWDFVKDTFKRAYSYKFRFKSFLGAYKYYTSYTLKTFDGRRYLERFEDRVAMTALFLAHGDEDLATALVDEIMNGRFQPATPTFLNAGKAQRGELVSCFLLRIEDNMESIGRAINSALQLSKRGGGVALLLSNIREAGAPIKHIENQSSGVIPVMKLLEDSFSYANQLGARQGAGAVYLNAHHPDIMRFLDTKRENADEKIRIKTLSLGVVIPDITFELAKRNDDMYLFSPYDVERVYGVPFADISITEKYDEMVEDPRIRKTKIKARQFFQTIAEIQFESGYPYILFEDTANRANPVKTGRINMSNLCSEILQVNSASVFNEDLTYQRVGHDISCNLGSLNIAMAMDSDNFSRTIETAIRGLTAVADSTSINSVPSVREGNDASHAIGLGQMNLHGYLGREHIEYGSEEGLDFTNAYFAAVMYECIRASHKIAVEKGEAFEDFDKSEYATGEFFDRYNPEDFQPKTEKVKALFAASDIAVPTAEEWARLKADVAKDGIYNRYLQAIPPTGSISYINNSTSSIHPIASKIEIRKEGKIGRVYYPAPHMDNENAEYFKDAYEIGYEKIIDTYAAATKYVDQGLSLTLFFKDTVTTRDINRAQIYAWRKGIKTLYYIRLRQMALEGTQVEGCVSCML